MDETWLQQRLQQNPDLARRNPDLLTSPRKPFKPPESRRPTQGEKIVYAPSWGPGEAFSLSIPGLRLVSESNQREHWTVTHRRSRDQRWVVYAALRSTGAALPSLPVTILLTRIAPRALDTDNAVASCKHVQDGVADWLAGGYLAGQDRQSGLTWQYTQRHGKPQQYGLDIAITKGRSC